MNQLQFIRIIMNENQQNTFEEIQNALDDLMRYCEDCWETPMDLQKMLYMQDILSSYSFQNKTKKKSFVHLLCT